MKACVPRHDFCMTLPFGAVVATLGVLGFVAKRSFASLVAGGSIGATLMCLGFASLRAWSSGASSLPWTAASAAVTATLAFAMGKKYMESSAIFPSGMLALTSMLMLCFYVKNLLVDGGNPPKESQMAKSD